MKRFPNVIKQFLPLYELRFHILPYQAKSELQSYKTYINKIVPQPTNYYKYAIISLT